MIERRIGSALRATIHSGVAAAVRDTAVDQQILAARRKVVTNVARAVVAVVAVVVRGAGATADLLLADALPAATAVVSGADIVVVARLVVRQRLRHTGVGRLVTNADLTRTFRGTAAIARRTGDAFSAHTLIAQSAVGVVRAGRTVRERQVDAADLRIAAVDRTVLVVVTVPGRTGAAAA